MQAKRSGPAASYSRGRQATGLADLVQAHGHLHAALQASLSCLQQAAAFTKKRAPGHHSLIAALIAIRAVLHVEGSNPPRATPKQAEYLREVYEGSGVRALARESATPGGLKAALQSFAKLEF